MSLRSRILKEPIVHFLVIGAALFGIFSLVADDQPKARQDRIVVSQVVVEGLATQFQASWRRRPTAEELARMIDSYVDDEILVREAKALLLDQGDTVIRQRLVQKMQFITKSAAAAMQPSDDELQTFYARNKDRYETAGEIAFEQVFLGSSPSEKEVGQVLSDLNSGRDPTALGVASLLPTEFAQMGSQQIDAKLGPGVFAAVQDLELGQWDGPIRTGYGYHLIKVTESAPASVPEFDLIQERILIDWRASIEETLVEKQLETMRARYSVQTPGQEEVEAIIK